MRNYTILTAFALFAAVICSGDSAIAAGPESIVQAGAAAVVITPSAEIMDPGQKGPVYLGGYGQDRIADPKQVLDDLWARTLVIQVGDTVVAFTALDSIGLFYQDALRIQELAREQLADYGITLEYIMIASSHTHHAPDTLGLWGPSSLISGINPYYQNFLIDKTAESIVQAALHLYPVQEIYFGSSGTSGLIRDTREPVVIDQNIYVMHLTGQAGQTIATLVNWASHPETVLGYYDEAITSDYVHSLRETVEAELGGVALFFNGAIGGLLTSLDVDLGLGTGREASLTTMQVIGQKAGEAALEAVFKSEPATVDRITITRKELYLPLENHLFYLAGILRIVERDLYISGRQIRRRPLPPQLGGPSVELLTEVAAVTIGEAQFVMVPGELYPELAVGGFLPPELAQNPSTPFEPAIKDHMTGRYNFLIGLANDEIGYIIPANDFVPLKSFGAGEHRVTGQKLYGEENSVGPSTAPILVRAVLEAVGGDSSPFADHKRTLQFNIPLLLLGVPLLAGGTLLFRRRREGAR